MSPILFLPLPIPHHASKLFWGTLAAMLAAGWVLERLGKPRSTILWMALGYSVGLFSYGDAGGLVGAAVGLSLGLASLRLSTSRSESK